MILRLDLRGISITDVPVRLKIQLAADRTAPIQLAALQCLLSALGVRDPGRRTPRTDPRIPRLVEALRAFDALRAGASHRAIALIVSPPGDGGWDGASDHLRSRVRRLVARARRLAEAGPKGILRNEV